MEGRVRQAVTVGGLLLAMVGLFLALARASDVLLLAYLAILFASILDHPITLLARYLPRGLATMAVVLTTLALLAAAAWLVWPTLREQAQTVMVQGPAALDRLEELWPSATHDESASRGVLSSSLRQFLERQLTALLGRTFPVALALLSALTALIVVLALSAFLAHRPQDLLATVARLTPERHRETMARLLSRMGRTISRWMLATLFNMVTTGALTALGLLALGIDSWLVLGFFMLMGEFVPFIGPVLAAIPGLAVGLTAGVGTGFKVLLVYLTVQQLEGNLLQPLVMRHALRIHPALLIVWALIMAALFGILGLMVAAPLLATIIAAVDTFRPEPERAER
jgi:predicted PurR-regulated permease PerM